MSNCKVIALTNQKGGVGKTTTAVNLGVSLAKQGKKILLIDADAQANLTMALGYSRPDDIPITLSTVMQSIIDDKAFDVSQGILHHNEGVDLLPSNIELSGFEVRLINAMSRERVLKTYVNEVKKNYDYVLIDCMPSLGMITINALAAADSVVIPTQPHYLSAKGLELLLRSVSMVKRQINPKLRIDGILMTMVMPRTNISKEITASVKSAYGQRIKVFDTEIPHSIRAVEATAEGKSIFAYTKMRNVGGIAQTEAQKSSDLFMKCRYLDEITGNRGTIFATGTPISNSMVELYSVQRYLQYDALLRNGLQHFDSWASTFGETVTALELAPEGTNYRAKTRFAKFFNLPELMLMFREVADIQTADMLKLPVPTVKYHNIKTKPSEIQTELVASLAKRAEKVRARLVEPNVDNMLKITNDGRKLALEGDLSGEVFVDGKPLKEIPSWERGKIAGNVFQDPRSQFFANEVAGEIAFGCENYGYSHEDIQSHVHRAAADIKIQDILDHSLHSLSYGMRQKVAIASAEAIDPEIYVMDEPSANLDIASTYRFADIIRDLKQQGKTIIIAEHRLYYLMDLADRFLCVQKGKIVREFTAQQMKALSNQEIRVLGLRTPDLHQIEQAEIPSAATNEVVLEVKKLNHSFGETIVAKDIDFQCRKGEVVALIGPNGTGKSTIGRILAGLLKEKSGEVVLFGKHCRPKGRLGKVWYIPQDLDSQLFGEDLLDELTTGAEVSPERKKAAEEILEALELMPFVKQHPSTLSGGQKQRLALGVALMHEAPIIVLDEPTSGLDGTNMRNVSRMIRKLAKMGRTIIVITHDAECALACCERAIRLENGCITDDFQIRGAELLLDKIGYDKKEG